MHTSPDGVLPNYDLTYFLHQYGGYVQIYFQNLF